MRVLFTTLLLSTAVWGAAVIEKEGSAVDQAVIGGETDESLETAVAGRGQSPNNREEKLFSVFQIVKFNNEMCSASNGEMGVCFTPAECTAKGGTATGTCAQGFGACCIFKANTCGSSVAQLVSYVESPNYPAAAPAGMCMFTLPRCDSSICQYKIQFEDVQLSSPTTGTCTNDTLTISGADAVSTAVIPPTLCGTLTGQDMLIQAQNTASIPKLTFNIASTASNSKWKIKITQVPCSTPMCSPGCLTCSNSTSGTISSYNNQNGNGAQINSPNCYAHCIAYQQGFCDVSLSASDFDIGTTDSLAIGTSAFNGMSFGTLNNLVWNFTGPYTVPVCLNGGSTTMNSGYNINYLLLPC